MRPALALALLGLLACAAADLEIQEIEGDTSTPGVTGSTYAILRDGQVVGVVEHYHSETLFGRRGGPADDRATPVLAQRLAELWASQADALLALRDRLMATRCPYARQMALAQLQVAAASAGAEEAPRASTHLLHRPALAAATKPMVHHGASFGASFAGTAGRPSRGRGGAVAMPRVFAEPHPTASSQDPMDHPEDLMDISTVQQQLLGPGGDDFPASGSTPGFNPDEPVASAKLFGAATDVEPLPMDALLFEGEEEEAPAGPRGRGAPLIPRRARGGAQAQPEPASQWAEPGWVRSPLAGGEPEEEGGPLPLLAVVLARYWRELEPREAMPLPGDADEAPAWHPRMPMPLMERRHVPADMPHAHIMGGEERPHPMHHLLGGEEGPHPMHHLHHGPEGGPMPRMVGGELVMRTPEGRWVPLSEVIRGPPPPFESHWSLFVADGSLNKGLVVFVALAVACAAVWGAMIVQYARFCRARNDCAAGRYFLARVESSGADAPALKPLAPEGPVKGGVEHASTHVDSTHRNVTVLHYEPLKSCDSEH